MLSEISESFGIEKHNLAINFLICIRRRYIGSDANSRNGRTKVTYTNYTTDGITHTNIVKRTPCFADLICMEAAVMAAAITRILQTKLWSNDGGCGGGGGVIVIASIPSLSPFVAVGEAAKNHGIMVAPERRVTK